MDKDEKNTIGINLSVLIQALILAFLIGFGTRIMNSIDHLTLIAGTLTTTTTVNSNVIKTNTAQIKENVHKIEQNARDIIKLQKQ